MVHLGKTPLNKLPDETAEYVSDHTDSFPKFESHCCRKDSRRLCLLCDLNLSIMYRLCVEKCNADKKIPVSYKTYRNIFRKGNQPSSFYLPKMNQYILCNTYKLHLAHKKMTTNDNYEDPRVQNDFQISEKDNDTSFLKIRIR